MTESVQFLLESFDRLPNAEKQEAITELLMRVRTLEFAPLSDEELVAAAEEVFLALDDEEAAHADT